MHVVAWALAAPIGPVDLVRSETDFRRDTSSVCVVMRTAIRLGICAGRLLKLIRSLEGDIFKHENFKDNAGSSDPVWEHVPFDDAFLADLNWMDGSALAIARTLVRQRGR